MAFARRFAALRSLLAILVVAIGLGTGVAGCGGSGDESQTSVRFVYVSWIEGIAMTHVMKVLVEDSLGYAAPLTQAGGATFAFSAVAEGDADVFLDAWLPTTHGPLWDQYGDRLVDLGPIYDSTTVGLVVPSYVDIDHVRDLPRIRDALGGEIVGIESGAAINQQTRDVLAAYDLADRFDVVSSSDAAMVSALQRAINNREPVVVTGWKPHWMWGRFDLRYLRGAQTGDTDVFGEPEHIRKLVRPGFRSEMPDDIVALLENAHIGEAAMDDLVGRFRPGNERPIQTARAWIRDHASLVRRWLDGGRAAGAVQRKNGFDPIVHLPRPSAFAERPYVPVRSQETGVAFSSGVISMCAVSSTDTRERVGTSTQSSSVSGSEASRAAR